MHYMSSTENQGGWSDEGPSWAAESVPMSVRKELLERELRQLGFRKLESQGGNAQQQQQQPQRHEGSSRPSAGNDAEQHGD